MQEPIVTSGEGEFVEGEGYVNAEYIVSASLSGTHFVHSLADLNKPDGYEFDYEKAFIYHRNNTNGAFDLVQSFDVSLKPCSDAGYKQAFTIDNGVLVMGGQTGTYIYVQQEDGLWDEVLMLEEAYNSIELSERNIIGTTWDDGSYSGSISNTATGAAYSFNVDACIPSQEVDLLPCELLTLFDDAIFEYDCEGCIPAIGMDGDSAVIARSMERTFQYDNYPSSVVTSYGKMHFLSLVDGNFQHLNSYELSFNYRPM